MASSVRLALSAAAALSNARRASLGGVGGAWPDATSASTLSNAKIRLRIGWRFMELYFMMQGKLIKHAPPLPRLLACVHNARFSAELLEAVEGVIGVEMV